MSSIDDGTQTVHTQMESNGWQDVVFHAKAMQEAIERYKANCATSQDTNTVNSTSSVTSQLSATGNAILTFINTIADTVDPLIKSLSTVQAQTNNSGSSTGSTPPSDAVSEITKKLADAQDAAMQSFKKSLAEIGASQPSTTPAGNDAKSTTPGVPAANAPLPPDLKAIQDEFDQMGGKTDPRMGMGKIPPQFLPKTT